MESPRRQLLDVLSSTGLVTADEARRLQTSPVRNCILSGQGYRPPALPGCEPRCQPARYPGPKNEHVHLPEPLAQMIRGHAFHGSAQHRRKLRRSIGGRYSSMKTQATQRLPLLYTHPIGSLPRPQVVRDLLSRRDERTADRLRGMLDDMVRFAIHLQEFAGLDVVSDGEWRRVQYIRDA